MTKEDVAAVLKKRGYDAYVDDGIVMVSSPENIKEKIKEEMINIGYDSSFGVTTAPRKKEEK